jgi:hypothetical protein
MATTTKNTVKRFRKGTAVVTEGIPCRVIEWQQDNGTHGCYWLRSYNGQSITASAEDVELPVRGKQGFTVDAAAKFSKKRVCNFLGDRGMPVSPSEILWCAAGTYIGRDYHGCDENGKQVYTLAARQAIAVIIKSKPRGCWDGCDTESGLMDIYSLGNIYGELEDEVRAPRGVWTKIRKSN